MIEIWRSSLAYKAQMIVQCRVEEAKISMTEVSFREASSVWILRPPDSLLPLENESLVVVAGATDGKLISRSRWYSSSSLRQLQWM